jgi:hypothetical protein
MSRKRKLENMVDMWKRLRRPFVLPQGTLHHNCEWETIDIDVLGCLVCGSVHACDVCTCKDVITTSDSVVCAVSGVVLRNQMYSEMEFVETVAMTGPVSQFEEDIAAEVEQAVHHMFLSASSIRQQRTALCELLLRWSRAGAELCGPNLLISCTRLARKAEQNAHVFAFVSVSRRKELVVQAADDCRRILRYMVNCGMPVKSQEVPRLTVGILYLMRHGIRVGCEEVLRQRHEVAQILPAENMLAKHYGIHPKFITETENRIKFCLRMKMA